MGDALTKPLAVLAALSYEQRTQWLLSQRTIRTDMEHAIASAEEEGLQRRCITPDLVARVLAFNIAEEPDEPPPTGCTRWLAHHPQMQPFDDIWTAMTTRSWLLDLILDIACRDCILPHARLARKVRLLKSRCALPHAERCRRARELVIQRHHDYLQGVLAHELRSFGRSAPEAIDDAASDVWLEILRGMWSMGATTCFLGDASFRTFIGCIARRCAARRRKAAAGQDHDAMFAEMVERLDQRQRGVARAAARATDDADLRAALIDCMAAIDPGSREVVAAWLERSIRNLGPDVAKLEIARQMGLAQHTFYRRLNRGADELRDCLQRKGFGPPAPPTDAAESEAPAKPLRSAGMNV